MLLQNLGHHLVSIPVVVRSTDNIPNLLMSMSLDAATSGNLLQFMHFLATEDADSFSSLENFNLDVVAGPS